MNEVAVVVPLHNRASRVGRLIDALEAQKLLPVEVVFVDDASTDGTAAALAAAAARTSLPLKVVSLDQNVGPAAARNAGWRATTAPVVAFTDDDCQPDPGWLAAGMVAIESDSLIGVAQGATRPEHEGQPSWFTTRRILEASPWFEGCNLFLRREALEASGGFGEELRMGFEDTWLGWAVLEAGWRRTFVDDAVVTHDVTTPGFRWHLREAWRQGNAVRVATRFPGFRATLWQPWALAPSHAAIAVGVGVAAIFRRARWLALVFAVLTAAHLWRARTSKPDLAWVQGRVGTALLDLVAFVSVVREAVRLRTFLL